IFERDLAFIGRYAVLVAEQGEQLSRIAGARMGDKQQMAAEGWRQLTGAEIGEGVRVGYRYARKLPISREFGCPLVVPGYRPHSDPPGGEFRHGKVSAIRELCELGGKRLKNRPVSAHDPAFPAAIRYGALCVALWIVANSAFSRGSPCLSSLR